MAMGEQASDLINCRHSHDDGDDDGEEMLLETTALPGRAGSARPDVMVRRSKRNSPEWIVANFVLLSVLFAANHGCVVACLGLATARLGSTGAWQSGLLYATYSFSGIAGSTYVVKELGARNAVVAGMGLYVVYVTAFWVATVRPAAQTAAAAAGAVVGGVGAGFLWTAQGSYFATAARAHARAVVVADAEQQALFLRQDVVASRSDDDVVEGELDDAPAQYDINNNNITAQMENSTAKLAGIFAFIYLAFEIGLRALSSVLLATTQLQWTSIFAVYAFVTVASTVFMVFVDKLEDDGDSNNHSNNADTEIQQQPQASAWYKITAAWQLLRHDPKMKHMIGLNAVFGLTSAFLSSYVNGEVVRVVLHDAQSKYVGFLAAWVSCVAAAMSLVFGRLAPRTGKGPILVAGALCFLCVALPFLVWPDVRESWGSGSLLFVYSMHGTGRATFEGTLKATFADYFANEKEGAFANIILQNGLASAVGFILTFTLHCSAWKEENFGEFCVQYRDGSIHDVLSFEMLIVLTAILAIFGYWRAFKLREDEATYTAYENISNAATEDRAHDE